MEVRESGTEHALGALSGILIHPDTGAIEGFFVSIAHFVGEEYLFLAKNDITHFGAHLSVRSGDDLSPAEDRLRLRPLLDDPRTFLGQRIVTESGKRLGVCADVQFDTDTLHVEWLFPKKFWRYGVALPISEVLEVREDAIRVRNQMPKEEAIERAEDTDDASDIVEVVVPT